MVWSPRHNDLLVTTAATALALAGGFVGGALGVAIVALAAAAGVAWIRHVRIEVTQATDAARRIAADEREARLLAEAATALLAAPMGAPSSLAPRVERALAKAGARLQLCHAPSPGPNETALPLRMDGGSGWLYVDREGPLSREEADRLQRSLTDLIGVAQERARVVDAAADSEANRRAEVEKTAVIHAISRDLRRPLVAMSTAADALGERDLAEHDRLELASVVAGESARLGRLVDDLLDLSRIEAGAIAPQPELVDVAQVVARALDAVRAERGDFEARTDLPRDLTPVRADAAQLERVFTKLIDNAARFSPAGRPVEIRGASANGRVTVRVVDHGRGITPAQQSQVFKPFVRGGRDSQDGSGLGLAICRGFVEANGGRITLQSRGRDGSAFCVTFPGAAQPSPVGSSAGGGRQIGRTR